MLNIDIDEEHGIATFTPDEKLSEQDFASAAHIIDPYIEEFGELRGLIIATCSFPGWESFAALLSHLSFVRDHHQKIAFIAFVTDSPIGNLAEHAANHFVSAQIRAFSYSELDSAKEWIVKQQRN